MAKGGYRVGSGRPRKTKSHSNPYSEPALLDADSEYAAMLDGGPSSSGPGEPNSSPAGRTAGTPEEPSEAPPWMHIPTLADMDPLQYALAVMRDPRADFERRDRMCIALLPYLHQRMADIKPGKKEMQKQAAEKATQARFAPSAPPKLAAVK